MGLGAGGGETVGEKTTGLKLPQSAGTEASLLRRIWLFLFRPGKDTQ